MKHPEHNPCQRFSLREAVAEIAAYDGPPLRIMEVCGTHTAVISQSGIRGLLPPSVQLLSGPGCPVCVTPLSVIDRLVALSEEPDTCVLCFGDLFRVPGTHGSLSEAKARGGRVRMIYAPLDALAIAESEPETCFVAAAVGFETTAPAFALLAKRTHERNLKNLRCITALRSVFPAIDMVLSDATRIDALICPGHVGAVTGTAPFEELSAKHRKPFVVCGFSAAHIAASLLTVLRMSARACSGLQNLYPEAVSAQGSPEALALMENCYQTTDAPWRGLGLIPQSGFSLRPPYDRQELSPGTAADNPDDCRCGDVLTGRISPPDCPLYGHVCAPPHPAGPCMVTQEGACGIWFAERRDGT